MWKAPAWTHMNRDFTSRFNRYNHFYYLKVVFRRISAHTQAVIFYFSRFFFCFFFNAFLSVCPAWELLLLCKYLVGLASLSAAACPLCATSRAACWITGMDGRQITPDRAAGEQKKADAHIREKSSLRLRM